MSDYLERTNNGTSFVGSDADIFGVLAVATALRLYAKTGMQVNRNASPTVMLITASYYTGTEYERGEYERAASDLVAYADLLKATPRT
jgi:hypothetical protein